LDNKDNEMEIRYTRIIKKIINSFRGLIMSRKQSSVLLINTSDNNVEKKIEEISRRINYFSPDIKIKIVKSINSKKRIDFTPIGLITSDNVLKSNLIFKKDQVMDFDYDNNHVDGWDYHRLLYNFNFESVAQGVKEGHKKLRNLKVSLSKKYDKAYIFGTGPSLEKAIERDWSDGIRIVSNTIVKDAELWNKINPHIIVASDGIYHFGCGKFAESFRKDLNLRLRETDTYFIFPDIFYPFCLKELPDHKDKFIPIPFGYYTSIHSDLTNKYAIPLGDNVLPMMLLPLATTLAKNVYLWGFDGRSPDDKLFWKNSSKHFYPEHVEELMRLHPAFYNKLVPKGSADQYVKRVHGDSLDMALKDAEKVGFVFKMMHFSYTKILQDRIIEE
jgi:hypothetical protein